MTTTKSTEEKSTKIHSGRSTYWTIVLTTWVVANWLLFRSLYREQVVTTADAASHIPLGLPFPFLYQDQSFGFAHEVDRVRWESSFPMRTSLWSPLEHPTHMIWPNYFLDLALVWGSLLLITLLILWVIQKARGTQRTGS